VLGEEEQAETVLQEMPEVETYTFEKAEEDGSIRIHIVSKDNADIRKELSVALSGAGLPILSMNRMEKSLEDIFLELTDEHAEAAVESESSNEEAEDEADDSHDEELQEVEPEKEENEDDSDL
jgi:vacuolar-type H+-ATPase subunit I/STV1